MSLFERAIQDLAHLHGKRPADLYVLLSKDGSTLVVDPGLKRPWSSPNKRLAEDQALNLRREGIDCYAIDATTALTSVLRHPKNQPPS